MDIRHTAPSELVVEVVGRGSFEGSQAVGSLGRKLEADRTSSKRKFSSLFPEIFAA